MVVIAAYAPARGAPAVVARRYCDRWRGALPVGDGVAHPDAAFGFRATRCQRQQTRYQTLEMMDTHFGRVMRLDNCFMTSERDEFFYHEWHGAPGRDCATRTKQALIIGGGDGGLAEELLNTAPWSCVVLAELDEG